MKNLLKVSKVVKEVLTEIPKTRNSDSYLYLKVLERFDNKDILDSISVPFFLCNIKRLKFPCFETVRRARQKIQEKCPELQANKEIREVRDAKEEVFHNYAIGEAVE
jgi:hypothetical protein